MAFMYTRTWLLISILLHFNTVITATNTTPSISTSVTTALTSITSAATTAKSSTSTTTSSTSTTTTSASTTTTPVTPTTTTITSTTSTSTTTSSTSTSTTTTSTSTTTTSTSTTTTTVTTTTITFTTSSTSITTTSTSTTTTTTSTGPAVPTTQYTVPNISNCSFNNYSSYLVSNNAADFASAQMCCQSVNMTLIEIESASEQARIENITTLIQTPFFIGLNPSCSINDYIVWLTGKPITFSSLGQPSTCSLSQQCFVYENNTSAQWRAVNCSLSFHFVCESYRDISYQWRRSSVQGNNNIQTAYLVQQQERTTAFQQINLGQTSLLDCSKSCFTDDNCISMNYDQGNCQLFLS